MVSVILPVYNQERLIGRAIKSIISQNFNDFEILVIDDGSFDRSDEIVKEFRDPRIREVKHSRKMGKNIARNTGIGEAQGRFLAFLDAKDEWLPTKLEKQMTLARSGKEALGVIYSGYWVIEQDKKTLGKVPQKKGDIFNEEIVQDWVSPTSCVLAKKECFDRVGGFDELLPACQDYDMWLRISKHFYFDFVKVPLANINFENDSKQGLSAETAENQAKAEIEILRRFDKEITEQSRAFRKRIYSSHYFALSKQCIGQGNASLGRHFLKKAIGQKPLNINYWRSYFASLIR